MDSRQTRDEVILRTLKTLIEVGTSLGPGGSQTGGSLENRERSLLCEPLVTCLNRGRSFPALKSKGPRAAEECEHARKYVST